LSQSQIAYFTLAVFSIRTSSFVHGRLRVIFFSIFAVSAFFAISIPYAARVTTESPAIVTQDAPT
jgi:hypothetical protein